MDAWNNGLRQYDLYISNTIMNTELWNTRWLLGIFAGLWLILMVFVALGCTNSRTFVEPRYECCKHNHGKCMGKRFPVVCGAYIPNAHCGK